MIKAKCKIGMKVIAINDNERRIIKGMTGTIRCFNPSDTGSPPIGIQWDTLTTGHTLDDTLEDTSTQGWYVYPKHLKLINNKMQKLKERMLK